MPFSDLEHTLKKAAAALREADIPFLLGGSLASWARGGPETRHDLDLMIRPEDTETATAALEAAGLRPEDPPEEGRVKAWDGDVLVDLIFAPKGMALTDEVIARGEVLSVLGMEMRVMALEDVLVTKLMALTEHSLRYESLLPISRALREQVDWEDVRARTSDSPFARAFFVMLEGLGILPGAEPTTGGRQTRVRVLTPQGSAAADAGERETMAEPITQTRLRELAAVHPEQGRVLSVFLNLDPAQFGTPAARSSAITSVITDAAHKVEEADGLTHEERMELRADVERVREVLIGSDVTANGTRAVAVYACGPEDLLEVVRLRRPVDNKVVLDRTPFVEPLVMQGTDERWMVLLANRRAARLYFGPGDALEETDRFVDDVHSKHDQGGWSQSRYQRSVEKDVHDHLQNTADLAFDLYKKRGADRVLIAAPDELVGDFKGKLHPYLLERVAGKIGVDIENASLDDVCAAASQAIEAHVRKTEREALDRLAQGVGT